MSNKLIRLVTMSLLAIDMEENEGKYDVDLSSENEMNELYEENKERFGIHANKLLQLLLTLETENEN